MPKESKVVELANWRGVGRGHALEELFRAHRAALLAFLRTRLETDADCDDIIQDVFCRLAKMDDLPGKVQSWNNSRAYLFSIAANLAVDEQRRRAVRRRHDAEQEHMNTDQHLTITPETIASDRQELDRVKQVITLLKPRVRQAFVLNRFRYLSYRQIAREMGIPVGRVEKYIARALVALRDAMDDDSLSNDKSNDKGKVSS